MTPRHAGPPEDPVYERLALERESRQVFAQAGSGRHAGSRLATAVRIGLVPVHRPVEPAPPLQAVRPLRAVEPLPEIVPESEWRPDPDPAAVAAAPAPWAPPLEDEEEPLEDFADGDAEDAAWSDRSEREVPPGEPAEDAAWSGRLEREVPPSEFAEDAAWADPEEPEEEPLASWTNPDGSWREDGARAPAVEAEEPAWGEEPAADDAGSLREHGDEEPEAGEEREPETAEWEPEIGDTWPPEAVASAPWRPPEGPVEEFLEDESDPVEDGSVDFESAGDAAAAAQDALVEESGAVEDLGFVEAGDPATESVGVHAVPPPRGSSEEEPATRTDRLATCVIRADDPFPPVTEALPVATTSLPRARPGQFPGGRSGRFPQEPTRHEPTPDPSGAAASAAATSVQEPEPTAAEPTTAEPIGAEPSQPEPAAAGDPAGTRTQASTAPGHAPVAGVIAATLVRLGVGHLFGTADAAAVLARELHVRGVSFTAARHEGAAAGMADAYSRIAGRLAAVAVPDGRGPLAAAAAIAAAAAARTPLIVLAAENGRGAGGSSARHEDLARAAGAVCAQVRSAASAGADTERAWRTAMRERRTVLLSVPADLLDRPAPDTSASLAPTDGHGASHRHDPRSVRAPEAEVAELVSLLREAERPVFIAGRGAREAGAGIAELARRCGALLATSTAVKGLFEGDADGWAPDHGGAAIGISGRLSTPLAAGLIRGADLIVSWGCALDEWTTGRGRLLDGVLVVQIDIEAGAIGAHRSVGLGIVGDCALVAHDALGFLDGVRAGYRTPAVLERIRQEGRWGDLPYQDLSDACEGRIDPRAVTIALDEALPEARIVTVDGSERAGYAGRFLRVPDVVGFCCSEASGPAGLGLASAIGAGIARPDRVPVLGTDADGFHRAVADLDTAVRLGMPLVVLVYNAPTANAASGDPDVAAVARGFGADGLTVRSALDLPVMAEAVRERTGAAPGQGQPLVIDARTVRPPEDA